MTEISNRVYMTRVVIERTYLVAVVAATSTTACAKVNELPVEAIETLESHLTSMDVKGAAELYGIRRLLYEARKEKGLTRPELAREAQVAEGTVMSIEAYGNIPNMACVFRLVKALGIPIDDVVKALDHSPTD